MLICDPEGEYDPIIKQFGGEVIEISVGSKDHIKVYGYGRCNGDSGNPIGDKSQLVIFHYLNN